MLAAIIRKAYRKPGPCRGEGAIREKRRSAKSGRRPEDKDKGLPSIEMERNP